MSLLQYLSQRLLLLALLISAGIFYIVYILYQWGLDDSTEYYLQQDSQWAQELINNNQSLPNSTQFKQFYLIPNHSVNSLPAIYSGLLEETSPNAFFFLQDNHSYHYGLFQIIDDERALVVVHQFPINDNAEGISLIEVSIILSAVLILMMLYGAWFIYQRISRSMQALQQAVKFAQPTANSNTQVNTQMNSRMDSTKNEFIEIDNIIKSLNQALIELNDKSQQERLFIQTLSHELRTPMATVQVALELLERKELEDNVREKLTIIFTSNQQMQNLAQDLLYLWSDTDKEQALKEKQQNLNLEHEFQQVVMELDQVFHCQQRFSINYPKGSSETLEVSASKAQVKLLLNNLCKNAIVHSEGEIQVSLNPDKIIICNTKSQRKVDPLVAGAGIGLIIAKRAAEQLGWKVQLIETEIEYEVCVVINHN